jgi:hypothetical protein
MFAIALKNINALNPAKFQKAIPYHMVYYSNLIRRTILLVRAERQESGSTLWYNPNSMAKHILLSPCGGSGSNDYAPGMLNNAQRPCCPMCTTLNASIAAGSLLTLSCRWPSFDGADVLGRPSGTAMMYAKLAADLGKTISGMKGAVKASLASGARTGKMEYSVKLSAARRSVKVTVPKTLKLVIPALMNAYYTATVGVYAASVDELYVGSPSMILPLFDYMSMKRGRPQDDGNTMLWGASGGLLFALGCGAARYWADLPWCILGGGFADYTYGKKTQSTAATPIWQSLTTGTALWAQVCVESGWWCITPLSTQTQDYSTIVGMNGPEAGTAAQSGDYKRMTCLLRHYTFFIAMLKCLSHGLSMLMSTDSGCTAADQTANRYNCLCRRRAKYLITNKLPPAKIAGKGLDKVLAETAASDAYAGTGLDNYTSLGLKCSS